MRRCWILVIALVAAAPRLALAQKAAADAAFREGKRLLEEGETESACAKFEGSLKLLVQLGVRLNLADCYERLGKLTAAYAEFRAAEIAANRAGDRRAAFARDRIAALEERMPTLTIALAGGADIPGLEIRRDGELLDRGLLDTPLPVDPGAHTVEATAPGREPWSTRIEAAEKARSSVEVPILRPEPAPVPGPAPPRPRQERSSAQVDIRPEQDRSGRTPRLLGIGIGATGAAALATGVVFGVQARGKWSDARSGGHCDDDGVCDNIGYPLARDARRAALTSVVLAGVGTALVATGLVLYIKGSRARRVTPLVRGDLAGLAVEGSF